MGFGGMILTHVLAMREGKAPFFFSRFNFTRMKECGNTHYCFYCGGEIGFRPAQTGRFFKRADVSKPMNQTYRGYDPMMRHDATHANGVIGNAMKYRNVWDWLEHEIGKEKDFPFVVSVPSV